MHTSTKFKGRANEHWITNLASISDFLYWIVKAPIFSRQKNTYFTTYCTRPFVVVAFTLSVWKKLDRKSSVFRLDRWLFCSHISFHRRTYWLVPQSCISFFFAGTWLPISKVSFGWPPLILLSSAKYMVRCCNCDCTKSVYHHKLHVENCTQPKKLVVLFEHGR